MQPLTLPQILALANKVVSVDDSENLLCANLAGYLRYANTSACDKLGYSFTDMMSKRIADYSPTYSDDSWNRHCQRTIANGTDQMYTYHQNCKGRRYPVVITSIPHIIDETSEQLICSLVKDAQSSVRYKRMLESISVSKRTGSFDFNLRDQSILVSDNLLAMLGTDNPETIKPSLIVDRLSREDVSRWNAEMIHFIAGFHRMDEQFVMRVAADRQAIVRVIIWSVMEDGKVTGMTGHYEIIDEESKERLVSLEDNQRRHIIKALRYTNGRVTGPNGAGKLLDINGKTLFARMKKLNINREDYTQR
ncbi:PAS domain-containing protein [Neolewinella sp.]|uniref:PAS domain-containing protein n=1 Tax=Neolewinella sp. TaxID=2993543 RepID=UPI003B51C9D6